MIWMTRKTTAEHWAKDQDRFGALQLATANLQMLMIIVHGDKGIDEIFVSLPDRNLKSLFPEYTEASTLPKVASLLVGSQTEFERMFEFPTSDMQI